MAKARKLKSGNWNIQILDYVDDDGKRHVASFTAPTKAEVEFMAARYKKDRRSKAQKKKQDMTIRQAIDKYITLSESLSPSTLQAYARIKEYAFQDIMDTPASKLGDADMQEAINRESRRRTQQTKKPLSPKTVKNEWGLLSAAIKSVCGITYTIRLPKVQRPVEVLPPPEAVIEAIRGTEVELPCLLAMWCGLRLSEIRALKQSSIQSGCLVISGAKLEIGSDDIDRPFTKTQASQRIIPIPSYIKGLFPDSEYLVPMTRAQIYGRFKRLMLKNGIEMSFHDLRHMYASISLNLLNIPSKIVQVSGGWSTSAVMERVYSQSFTKAQIEADERRDEYFSHLLFCTNTLHKPEMP